MPKINNYNKTKIKKERRDFELIDEDLNLLKKIMKKLDIKSRSLMVELIIKFVCSNAKQMENNEEPKVDRRILKTFRLGVNLSESVTAEVEKFGKTYETGGFKTSLEAIIPFYLDYYRETNNLPICEEFIKGPQAEINEYSPIAHI